MHCIYILLTPVISVASSSDSLDHVQDFSRLTKSTGWRNDLSGEGIDNGPY